MITITINQREYQKLKKFLHDERFRHILGQTLYAAGLDLEGKIVENISERASNTGRLLQSWTVKKESDTQVKVFTNVHYAPYVEFGTKPHRPPIDPIRKWVHEKFQLTGKKLQSTAWAVWQKIAKEGTPAKRYLRDALKDFDLNKYVKELIRTWENV